MKRNRFDSFPSDSGGSNPRSRVVAHDTIRGPFLFLRSPSRFHGLSSFLRAGNGELVCLESSPGEKHRELPRFEDLSSPLLRPVRATMRGIT